MTQQKTHWIIAGFIMICGLIIGIAIIGFHPFPGITDTELSKGNGVSGLQGFDGPFLDTALPKSPPTIPKYRVISVDRISESQDSKIFTIKKSVPSAEEAPSFAEKGLKKYGGLPKDAQLGRVVPNSVYKYNLTTNSNEETNSVGVQVFYSQKVDGFPVKGAHLSLRLGDNGEIVDIRKDWGVYEYAGEVKVISAEKAYEKLRNYETTDQIQAPINMMRINDVQLGYELPQADPGKNDLYLKPVWIFSTPIPADPSIQNSQSFSFPLMVDATIPS